MDIKLLDQATDPGSAAKANEDAIVIADNLYVVLDGATGLGEQAVNSLTSDAVWFVEAFAGELKKHWHTTRNFPKSLDLSIQSCRLSYSKATAGAPRPAYECPSAGMVAGVVEDDVLHFYRLGDCSIYCKDGPNAQSLFGWTPLMDMDARSILAFRRELQNGLEPRQARAAILPILREHRGKMNKPGGYGALSIDPDCLRFLDHVTLPIEGPVELLLASDGFCAAERYFSVGPGGLFERSMEMGLDRLIKEIRFIEGQDYGMSLFPRLKPSDDATAVLVRCEPSPITAREPDISTVT